MSDKSLVVGPDQMPGWLKKRANIMREIDGQLIRGLQTPGQGLTLDQLQLVAEHRVTFHADMDGYIRKEWQEFYRKYFRLSVDFSGVTIPEALEDFIRAIFIAKGLTFAQIIKTMKKHFPVSLYTEDLDKAITENVRTSNKSYAIRVRDRIEADEEMKNLSANDLKAKDINSITLMERLILELKYWDETGKHLDISNITLCAGSRDSHGGVPNVDWSGGELGVGWCSPDIASGSLRARVVVS